MTPPADAKRDLRRTLRARRLDHVRDLGDAVIPVPAGFAARVAGRVVAGYAAVAGEADPALLLAAVRAAGGTILLPHIAKRGADMRFVQEGPTAPGPYGVPQPVVAAAAPAPGIVLLPLVGFDRAGNRLGQGGGHYDRALAALPAAVVAIGVAFALQEIESMPTEPWDRPLAGVVTDRGLRWFGDAAS